MKKRIAILFIGDLVVLSLSFCTTLYIGFWGNITLELVRDHLLPFGVMYVFWLLLVFLFNFYQMKTMRPSFANVQRLGGLFISLIVVGGMFFYLTTFFSITPKTNLFINVIIFGFLWMVWRRLFYSIFAKNFKQTTLIVGSAETTQKLANEFSSQPQYGIDIVRVCTSINEALPILQNQKIDLIIVESLRSFPKESLPQVFKKQTKIIAVADAYESFINRVPVECIDEMWFIHGISGSLSGSYNFIKHSIGYIVSLIILIATSPLLIIIALAITLETRGPILIKQKRVGKNNKTFLLYKFRSMLALDADGQAEQGQAQWAQGNDPRITRVGKIIRALHIDEIPQLFNVLRGDIVLVGPRPERPEFVDKLENQIPHYHLRHIITPGFTGWAQIKFRYARSILDSKTKFEYDLYYIKNRNVLLDLGIMIKTIQIIFTH